MAQDAQLISQAGLVESLASDGLVSVSTGAGQPQKNMELAKFADSLGSSVPLQQTSEQVSITGLYARTSDGKMVELTKESVASVMAGLIGTATVSKDGLKSKNDFQNRNIPDKDINKATYNGAYEGIVSNAPDTSEYFLYIVINRGIYVYQIARGLNTRSEYTRCSIDSGSSWSSWKRIDNFGYNSLAELSSGVAGQMALKFKGYTTVKSGESLTLTSTYGFCFLTSNQDKHVFFHQTYSGRIDIIFQTDQNGDYTNVKDTEGRVNLYKSDNDKLVIQNKSSKDYGIYWIMFGV